MNDNICTRCGAPFPAPPKVGPTGYAVTSTGAKICYPCSDADEIKTLLKRGAVFCAYLSSDGQHITTWPGGILGEVIWSKPCKLTRRSWTHGTGYRSVRIRDVHGNYWSGRGSPGIFIRLRPVNKPRRGA